MNFPAHFKLTQIKTNSQCLHSTWGLKIGRAVSRSWQLTSWASQNSLIFFREIVSNVYCDVGVVFGTLSRPHFPEFFVKSCQISTGLGDNGGHHDEVIQALDLKSSQFGLLEFFTSNWQHFGRICTAFTPFTEKHDENFTFFNCLPLIWRKFSSLIQRNERVGRKYILHMCVWLTFV